MQHCCIKKPPTQPYPANFKKLCNCGEMHQIEVFEKLQDMGYKIKVVVT